MSKTPSSTDVLAKVIAELQKLEVEDRARVMRAAQVYFGHEDVQSASVLSRRTTGGAVAFFDQKQPKTKLEELAVAARYREETAGADTSTQEELRAVFNEARRAFDANNFRRDIENARGRNLFLRGTARNAFQLSSDGQKLVDALPDRTAAKELSMGRKRSGAKRKKT